MQIILCSKEIHDELRQIAAEHPELVFDNNGFEYLKPEVREAKAAQINRVSEILKEHVLGFSKFFNFKPRKHDSLRGDLDLRFDYNWSAETLGMSPYFVGVGYLPIKALHLGFEACGMRSQC